MGGWPLEWLQRFIVAHSFINAYRVTFDDPEVASMLFGRVLRQKPPHDAVRVDAQATLQDDLVANRRYCWLGRPHYVQAKLWSTTATVLGRSTGTTDAQAQAEEEEGYGQCDDDSICLAHSVCGVSGLKSMWFWRHHTYWTVIELIIGRAPSAASAAAATIHINLQWRVERIGGV